MGYGKMGGKLSAFSDCDTWLKYPNDIPFSHDNKTTWVAIVIFWCVSLGWLD